MILPFVRERQSILGLQSQSVASYKRRRAVKAQQDAKKKFVSWAYDCPLNFVFQRCQSNSQQKEVTNALIWMGISSPPSDQDDIMKKSTAGSCLLYVSSILTLLQHSSIKQRAYVLSQRFIVKINVLKNVNHLDILGVKVRSDAK